jgi:predicted nucleic acid-binding protein
MKNIYTDTSVIGGCFDTRFKRHSLSLFETFKKGELKIIFSDVTLDELQQASEKVKNKMFEVPTSNIIRVTSTDEVHSLANGYIHSGALTRKSYCDAMHIALATLNEADGLASWNFKHIINFNKIKKYNEVNKLFGYKQIEIMTPTLILKTINYEEIKTI